MQSSWSLLPPAHQIPQAAGAAQDPALCALLGRRTLGAIGDPCCRSTGPSRRAQQSNPQSPQFVSIQSRTGLPGLPQNVGTLSMTDYLLCACACACTCTCKTSIHDPSPTWQRLKDLADLSTIAYQSTWILPLRNSHPRSPSLGTSPPRHPSPKHLFRPLSRISPRPARFTATSSSATSSLPYFLALLASFILLDNRSTLTLFFALLIRRTRSRRKRRTSPHRYIHSSRRQGQQREKYNSRRISQQQLAPTDIPVR